VDKASCTYLPLKVSSQVLKWLVGDNMVRTNTLNYWWDHINNTRIKIYAKEINHPSIIPTLLASSLHFTRDLRFIHGFQATQTNYEKLHTTSIFCNEKSTNICYI
jgi:hypothetical protein